MASLEERGDSVRVTWRLGGTRTGARQSCTFTGDDPDARNELAKAAKALAEAREHNITRVEMYAAILGEPERGPKAVPTFKQWSTDWIAQRRLQRDVEESTLNGYERTLRKRVWPMLGHLRLTDIDRPQIQAWVAWMSSRKLTQGSRDERIKDEGKLLSPSTIRGYYSVVSGCLSAAVPEWIPANPAAPLPGDRKRKTGLPKLVKFEGMFLNPEEIGLILAQCDQRTMDLIVVALRTGLRIGELMALDCRHVLFGRDGEVTILVRQTMKKYMQVGAPKSPASVRDVAVSGSAAAVLRRLTAGRKASAPVFTNPAGQRWEASTFYKSHYQPALGRASRCEEHPPALLPKGKNGRRRRLPYTVGSDCDCAGVLRRLPRFHDLRHTHASALIDKGWHPRRIQRRLGHSSFMMTMQIYGHLMEKERPEALASIDSWFELAA